MIDPEEGDNEVWAEIDEMLAETRSRRFTVYIAPELAEGANQLVSQGPFETMSVLLDTAIRRQMLHEIQVREAYEEWPTKLENLSDQLISRVTSSRSTGKVGDVGDSSDGRKVILPGRTTPGIYLVESVLIEDENIPLSSESAFVEAGIRRLLPIHRDTVTF